MNLTDKTYPRIPEAAVAISAGQKTADIPGIYTGNLNDPGAVELPVIARIPNLDAPQQPSQHRRSSRSRTVKPASTRGRLLSAGLSLNVLLGLGLVLLLGAIAPYAYVKIADGIQSESDNAMGQAWQATPPASTADLAPAWKPLAAQQNSSTQLWSEIAGPNVQGSLPSLTSSNTASVEKENTTSSPKINAIDERSLAQQSNNIMQSNMTTPLVGSRTNETLAAEIKPAAEKGSGIMASPQPGETDPGPAASVRSSAWPRIADDQANFSPWPNPRTLFLPRLIPAATPRRRPVLNHHRPGPTSCLRLPIVGRLWAVRRPAEWTIRPTTARPNNITIETALFRIPGKANPLQPIGETRLHRAQPLGCLQRRRLAALARHNQVRKTRRAWRSSMAS